MKSNFFFQIILITMLLVSCSLTSTQKPELITTSPLNTTYPSNGAIEVQNYIGVTYPPYPDSVVFQWGASIYPSKDKNKWSVSRVSVPKADGSSANMLWLSKVTSSDVNGIPKFEVSDALVLPVEEDNNVVAVSTCLLSGVVDPEIVALAKWDDSIFVTRFLPNSYIFRAWRANQATGKFEESSIQHIERYYE